jgi:hypothetical protein
MSGRHQTEEWVKMSFFSASYQGAKQRFVGAAQMAGAQMHSLKLEPPGPNGEELTIDIAVIGDLSASKILLHTSGIHGVEGFAGSAVQVAALLNHRLNHRLNRDHGQALPPNRADVAIVFVHCLNPFGMAWLRRVNENNVDLNRGFLEPSEAYRGSDPNYKRLDNFLNSPASVHWFWPQVLYNLGRFGFSSLKNAVVQGQYDFPKGLFYGGDSLQEGPRLYKQWLKKHMTTPKKKVVAIDVHTGLGRFGQEVLFCHRNHEAPDIGKKITALSETVGYKVRGGLETLTNEVFPGATWAHFTQEFGTYSMAKILKTLREENFHFQKHHSVGSPSVQLRQCMNPENNEWQGKVVQQGLATFWSLHNWLDITI